MSRRRFTLPRPASCDSRGGHASPARLLRQPGRARFTLVWMAIGIACAQQAHAETANRIAAIVNDEIITEADVRSHLNALLDEGQTDSGASADPENMHETVLQHLIQQRLMLQEAKRAGVTVTAEEVVSRLEELRSRIASEDEYREALADAGLTEEQLKDRIREQLMVQRVIEMKVRASIVVSPQEVAREIGDHPELAKPGDRVHALHLLIRVGGGRSEEEARALIHDLHQQILQGGDFAALAAGHSEDPHRERGGELGWVAQGDLLPELGAALFSLKAGEVSGPIQTRLGFHLVKVLERKTTSSLSVMEANRAVYQQLYQQKVQQAFQRWLEELRRRAYIEVPS